MIVASLVLISNVLLARMKSDPMVFAFVAQFALEAADTKLPRLMPSFFQTENLKYGFIDKSGSYVVSPRFDDAGDFHEGLALVRKGNRWGYLTTDGSVAIPFQFHRARDFSYGLAAVRKGKLWTFIDRNGELITQSQFVKVDDFGGSFAVVHDLSHQGLLDRNGSMALPITADTIGDFKDGISRIQIDGKTGYFNDSGKWLIEPTYDEAGEFSQGLAAFQKDGKWGYLNTEGEVAISPQYFYAGSFIEGSAVVGVAGGKSQIIDREGQVLVPKAFSKVAVAVPRADFSKLIKISASGLTPVADTKGWGYASNETGEIVIDTQFPEAQPFFEGLACVGSEVSKNSKDAKVAND